MSVQGYAQTNCILPGSFFEGRTVPKFHPKSRDARQWWMEQKRRCMEGWSDGGFNITGRHYFHLNFRKMRLVLDDGRRISQHPYYSDSDEEVFKLTDEARARNLGLLLITGRGWGKSYYSSTLADYEFTFFPTSEVVVSASIKKYADKLWAKCMEGLNSLPMAFKPTLLTETKEFIESGYKVKENGKDLTKGFRSIMQKIIFADDPGATRGGRPDIHIFEEIGSWKNLINCFEMSQASWWVGKTRTCFPLLIGTGGEMKSGKSEGARRMFLNPSEYGLMSFEDPDQPGKKISLFIPAYMKFGGTYEEDGVSKPVEAKEFLEQRRKSLEKVVERFNQEIQEFPFKWEEAFYLSGSNVFDSAKLNQQLKRLNTKELEGVARKYKGEWIRTRSGQVTSVLMTELSEREATDRENEGQAVFEICEHPVLDPATGKPYENLHISGADSYDTFGAEDETGESDRSKGSIMMYRRILGINQVNNLFVAKCTMRNSDADAFYEATAMLNYYYNSKMLYEHTKIGIATWYENNHFLYMLYPRPKAAYAGVVQNSKANNKYGLSMPIQIKEYCIELYQKYIKNYSWQMYFESQLKDAVNFQWGSNKHDESMAAAICLAAVEDMHFIEVKSKVKKPRTFPKYQRDASGKKVFA